VRNIATKGEAGQHGGDLGEGRSKKGVKSKRKQVRTFTQSFCFLCAPSSEENSYGGEDQKPLGLKFKERLGPTTSED